jgi:CO/xanthine dehydrogenase Mo-binding subunit
MKAKGRGVACCIYSATVPAAPNPCSANVQMREDGSVVIQTGATEIGQGSNTVLASIAAEALGVDIDKVTIYSGDTGTTPYDFGTLSSRLTFTGGNAILEACKQVKEVLLDTASKQLQVPVERLTISPGLVHDKDNPSVALPIPAAAALSIFVFRKLPIGTGYYYPKNSPVDEYCQGSPIATFSYTAVAAEVEVDTETGVVEVNKIYTGVDCGTAINPMFLEGQLHGGAIQGLGLALTEDGYPYMNTLEGVGKGFNPAALPDNFSDYAIPTAMDIPEVHAFIVEKQDSNGPFGAKAAGEITLNGVAPAIINAIYDAVGVRIFDIPATPDKVLKAIKEKEKNQKGGTQ